GERDKRRPMETAGAIYRECHALLVVHGHDLGLAVTVYRVEQRSYHAARQCEHVRYLAHGEPVGEVITDSSRRLIPDRGIVEHLCIRSLRKSARPASFSARAGSFPRNSGGFARRQRRVSRGKW